MSVLRTRAKQAALIHPQAEVWDLGSSRELNCHQNLTRVLKPLQPGKGRSSDPTIIMRGGRMRMLDPECLSSATWLLCDLGSIA